MQDIMTTRFHNMFRDLASVRSQLFKLRQSADADFPITQAEEHLARVETHLRDALGYATAAQFAPRR